MLQKSSIAQQTLYHRQSCHSTSTNPYSLFFFCNCNCPSVYNNTIGKSSSGLAANTARARHRARLPTICIDIACLILKHFGDNYQVEFPKLVEQTLVMSRKFPLAVNLSLNINGISCVLSYLVPSIFEEPLKHIDLRRRLTSLVFVSVCLFVYSP